LNVSRETVVLRKVWMFNKELDSTPIL
jgi:hypothetical protein